MTGNKDFHMLNEKHCGTIWASPHIQQNMETLCYRIGRRPVGSENMRRARSHLAGHLRQLGAKSVHTEGLPVRAWSYEPSHTELQVPYRRVFDSYQQIYSVPGQVTARLVDAGYATKDELERLGRRCKGAVVLSHAFRKSGSGGRYVTLQKRVKDICARNPAAIILRALRETLLPTIEMVGGAGDVPVPVVCVSSSSGAELAAAARSSRARARLETTGTAKPGKCANLIGELGPQRKTDEIVVLSAHLDAQAENPGAFDNLTGVLTLIEIARALAPLQRRFRRTLRLILFTGEEYGFLGSKAYVKRHHKQLDRFRFVFNMDSLYPDTAAGVAVMWSPEMRDYLDQTLVSTGRDVEVRDMFCMSSDYIPFMLEGVPTARPAAFNDPFPPQSHSILDTPDRVPLDWIRKNAITYAPMMLRILTDPKPLPVQLLATERVAQLLRQEQVEEYMQLYGFTITEESVSDALDSL